MQTNSATSLPIVKEVVLDAPVEKVWTALTDKNEMKKWYFDLAEFKPETGFVFEFLGGPDPATQYVHICEVTVVVTGKKLTYSWEYKGYDGISYVSFELFPEGDKTLIKLTHTGIFTFSSANK